VVVMSNRWVVVDGYSVLHAWTRFATRKARRQSLQQRREGLVGVLRQYGDHTGRKITAIFDGYAARHKPEIADATAGVDVLFSERGKTADDMIERLVAQAENRAQILVVTSDGMERQTVESLGCQSMSAEVFEAEVEAALAELGHLVRSHGRHRRIGSLRNRLEE
jgi:uncharacterized protein